MTDEIEAIRALLARRGPHCTPDPWEQRCEVLLAALDERTLERDEAQAQLMRSRLDVRDLLERLAARGDEWAAGMLAAEGEASEAGELARQALEEWLADDPDQRGPPGDRHVRAMLDEIRWWQRKYQAEVDRWCDMALRRDAARAAGYAEGIAAAVAWLRAEADGHERRTHETGYLGGFYAGTGARQRARVLRTLALSIEALPRAEAGITVTSAEFRADARACVREAMAGKTVTVTGDRGEPRMVILGQTEPLDDAAYAAAPVPSAEEIRAAMAAGAEELRRLMRGRRP